MGVTEKPLQRTARPIHPDLLARLTEGATPGRRPMTPSLDGAGEVFAQLDSGAVDWLLYNLSWLRFLVSSLVPKVSSSILLFQPKSTAGNPIVDMAVRRAEISVVLDAVERGIRVLHREDRQILRMRYLNFAKPWQIEKRLFLSERKYYRRLHIIRAVISQHVGGLGEDILAVFWQQIKRLLA